MQQPNQNLVIAQVCNFLNANGYFVWRQENNGRIDKAALIARLLQLIGALKTVNYTDEQIGKLIGKIIDDCYRPVPSSRKGISDVIGFHLTTGIWISVEVKWGKDDLRPEQQEFRFIVKESNAEYWLCREIESFKAGWYRKHQPQLEPA